MIQSQGKTLSYDLYLDDSGPRKPYGSDDSNTELNYFAYGGYLVESERAVEIDCLHQQFVSNWAIDYPLHSTKIRGKRQNFEWLFKNPKADLFHKQLDDFIMSTPVYGAACVIDREGYTGRYSKNENLEQWSLCKSAYHILIERALKFAVSRERKLSVFVEQTGKKEDRAIKQYHEALRSAGQPFNRQNSGKYCPLNAEDFREGLIKNVTFLEKKNPRIQLADLLAYPLARGQYDPDYLPYLRLIKSDMVVDQQFMEQAEIDEMGLKHYCADKKKVLKSTFFPV